MIVHVRRRAGFSLIEIMVVLAIIGTLVALSVGAIMRIQIVQQNNSSADIVEKVQVAVDNQYKAILAQAQLDMAGKGAAAQDAQALLNYMGGDVDAATALLVYCRIRQNFPQTFAEVQLPQSFTVNGVATPYFTVGGAIFPLKKNFLPFVTMSSANFNASQQSAALLYAAVADSGAGGSTFVSAEATSGNQGDFTLNGATIHTFMDSWRQPIGFCRFGTNTELNNTTVSKQSPTIYVNVNATYNSTYKVYYQDPLDPAGKLYLWRRTNVPNNEALAAETVIFLNNGDPANATLFDATNRRPVVYSIGWNGIYESLTMNPTSQNKSAPNDDILGYRLTQLGQKGTK